MDEGGTAAEPAAVASGPRPAPAELRRNRTWLLLWSGQSISSVGNYVFDTTVVLWISTVIARGQSWAPAAVSGALIAATAPAVVVGPVAGVFVDRWNRRRIMIISDMCRAVLIAALLPLAWPSVAGHLPVGARLALIYAVIAVASCFAQFFNPAGFGVLAAVVGQENIARATGLFQATGNLAAIVGPPLAAPLLIVFGVQWALVINALSFAVSFGTLVMTRLAEPGAGEKKPHESFRREFTAGLRFFAGSRVLVALMLGATVATLGTGALTSLNVFFLQANLHASTRWYGLLAGADGIGGILGALAAGWIASRIAPKRLFWGGLILSGIVVIAYSRMQVLGAALAMMALVGIIVAVVNVVISPLLLGATPQDMLGRVIAVVAPIQQVAGLLSLAVAGFLASTALHGMHVVAAGMTFGTYDTIFGVCGLLFIAGGLVSIRPLRDAGNAGA